MSSYNGRKAFDIFTPHHCFIEGHRGMNKLEPENTLDSYKHSIEAGLDGIELDIWLTKDKIPVVIHGKDDGDISATTNGKGRVKEMTLSELRQYKTLNGNKDIPMLEEVLKLCKNKIFLNIELKDPDIKETFAQVIKLIETYDMINQIAFSSFKHEYAEEVKKYKKDIIQSQKDKKKFIPYNFEVSHCSMNIYGEDINKEMVDKIHSKGNTVMCWFGVKDAENEEIYRKIFDLGVEVLCCNEPDKALAFRNKYYNK